MGRARRVGRSPVTQFALSGVIAIAIVGAITARLVTERARSEALRDARNVTQLAGRGIVAPALTRQWLDGSPEAKRAVDRIVRERVLRAPVVRVKIWRADGTILYSDEPRLIGERYDLGADEREVLDDGGVEAELSDLGEPENRFERGFSELREVYIGVRPAGGGPRVLFEEYLRDSSIDASGADIRREFAPVLIGALIILAVIQLPLAAGLARRLRRGQREREQLLQHAVASSELERRRIARDLHDGVVQDLAAVSYRLGTAAGSEDPRQAREAIEGAGGQVRGAIRQLRTLLVELYPASLHREGLEPALKDLLSGVESRSIRTTLEFDHDVELDRTREALLFRTAREALSNVTDHAQAKSVDVAVRAAGDAIVLDVTDDGRGMTDAADDGRPRFGLKMLDDLAGEHGGSLEVGPADGGGTRLRLTLPRR